MAAHGETVAALERKPVVSQFQQPAWLAFDELTTCRPVGMAVGPIPWTAIDAYAARHGITDPDDHEDFVTLVRAMDDAFLDHQHRKAEAKN